MRRSPSLCPDSGPPSELIDNDVHCCVSVVPILCIGLHWKDKWQTSSVQCQIMFLLCSQGLVTHALHSHHKILPWRSAFHWHPTVILGRWVTTPQLCPLKCVCARLFTFTYGVLYWEPYFFSFKDPVFQTCTLMCAPVHRREAGSEIGA